MNELGNCGCDRCIDAKKRTETNRDAEAMLNLADWLQSGDTKSRRTARQIPMWPAKYQCKLTDNRMGAVYGDGSTLADAILAALEKATISK